MSALQNSSFDSLFSCKCALFRFVWIYFQSSQLWWDWSCHGSWTDSCVWWPRFVIESKITIKTFLFSNKTGFVKQELSSDSDILARFPSKGGNTTKMETCVPGGRIRLWRPSRGRPSAWWSNTAIIASTKSLWMEDTHWGRTLLTMGD